MKFAHKCNLKNKKGLKIIQVFVLGLSLIYQKLVIFFLMIGTIFFPNINYLRAKAVSLSVIRTLIKFLSSKVLMAFVFWTEQAKPIL